MFTREQRPGVAPEATIESAPLSVGSTPIRRVMQVGSVDVPFATPSGSNRIRRMEHSESGRGSEHVRAASKVRVGTPFTSQPTAGPNVIRRDLAGSRAEKLAALDKAANDKRLAHAKNDYVFDKSLQTNDAASSATNDRLAQQRGEISGVNDVGELSDAFVLLYQQNPDEAIKQAGFTPNQAATARARMNAKDTIPKPADLLPPSKIAAHLGKFAKGAHAFIDPTASKKIEGEITDTRFKGWGIDANFVAPLDEANALNAKAHTERGIETIEDELGIPSKYWSKSAWNPGKELVRWVIPKPKLSVDDKEAGVLLEMATGQESGADSKLWVAGGLTKGGASEAVLQAIPREQLMKHLADGQIRQKIETYPETRDNVE